MPLNPYAAVAHSWWGRGGAEIAAVWIIHALQEAGYFVEVITRGGFDPAELSDISGAPIDSQKMSVKLAPNIPLPFMGFISHGLFLRQVRREGEHYSLRVSPSEPLDWSAPAIHFLSSGIWNESLRSTFMPSENRLSSLLGKISNLIAGQSSYAGSSDLFVANSEWTRDVSSKYCKGEITVLAPPVVVPEGRRGLSRNTDFVCLGRIEPEKRVEACVRIISAVRERGFSSRLHIVGPLNKDKYSLMIGALARENPAFVELHGPLYGHDKWQLLDQCRFAISACQIEAFGMAAAEMARRGLVVFAPDMGGQREVIGNKDLLWTTEEEAVDKICTVLSQSNRREELSVEMVERTAGLSSESFVSATVGLVERFQRNLQRSFD